MDFEYLLPSIQVWPVYQDMAIEPSRPEQCRIQYFRPIGRRHDDDPFPGIKPIHLRKELVEGLLPLIMAAANRTNSPGFSQSIQLVNENDAGSLLLGLGKEVPDPSSPNTHEHLHEIRPTQAQERNLGLTRNGFGKKGLPRSRRSHQQHTLRNLTP